MSVSFGQQLMEQRTLNIVNKCMNTNIYSYLETSGGQSYNLYLNFVHFFNTSLKIRHLWQLKTVVFLHWCLMCAVPLVDKSLSVSTKVSVGDKKTRNRR